MTMAASMMLASCSKNDEQPPEPEKKPEPDKEIPSPEAKKLQSDIIGKWEFKGISIKGNAPVNANSTGFIKFYADSVYAIFDGNGDFFSGRYEAKNSNTITLQNVGVLNDLVLTKDQANFKVTNASTNKINIISSNKIVQGAVSNLTQSLCRVWKEVNETGYSSLIGATRTINDDKGNFIRRYIIDNITYELMTSNTYSIINFAKNVAETTENGYWEWHPTKPNIYLQWRNRKKDYDNNSTNINQVSIDVLNKDAFKLSVDDLKLKQSYVPAN